MIQAETAVELFQSALQMHDDIMDRDQLRRGFGSVFYQYAQLADRAGIADSYHLGESLGISAGDIANFLAFEVLSRLLPMSRYCACTSTRPAATPFPFP